MHGTEVLVERRTRAFQLGLLLALLAMVLGRAEADLDPTPVTQLLVLAVVTGSVLALEEVLRPDRRPRRRP